MKTEQKPAVHPDRLQTNIGTVNMASSELGKSFFLFVFLRLNSFAVVAIKFCSATGVMLALANISQRG